MGGLFIAVVVLFPNGLAGLVEQITQRVGPWLSKRREADPVPLVSLAAGRTEKGNNA
jgi:hypothetical protein